MKNISKLLLSLIATTLIVSSCKMEVTPNDWPQFKKDNHRSGVSSAQVDLSNFGLTWTHDTEQEPIPAWYGPAKEDAFARSGALPSMRDYDLSYYPIIVDNYLYYGSSADDGVHCINTRNGKTRWTFTSAGPIRIAPTFYDGKIYFGSDDGYAYCLNARNGDLVWKFSPTETEKTKLFNNGRFISFFPIRTGILIEDGKAFFGASLLPWKKSYVCAVDAQTGEVNKKGTYIKEYDTNSMTLEGSMASNGKLLIQPQGRIAPIFIKKSNGERAGALSGTGGCFVLVTPEKNVVHANTSRNISMKETSFTKTEKENKQALFMSYKDGKEIVVYGDSTFVLNDNSLVAYNRTDKKMLWLRRNFYAHRIILVGETLFLGSDDKLLAVSTKNGQTIWESPVNGTIYALAFANGSLYASTSNGEIHKFGTDGTGGNYFAENTEKKAVIEPLPEKQNNEDKLETLRTSILYGPYVEPISTDSAKVIFSAVNDMAFGLVWKGGNNEVTLTSKGTGNKHEFIVPIRKGFSYYYTLTAKDKGEANYYYDNFFNFFVRESPQIPAANAEATEMVKAYLATDASPHGLSMVLGESSDQTAFAIATLTAMDVVNVESSKSKVEDFKTQLQAHKSYGRKISALAVESLNQIPILSELVDLVWVNKGKSINPDEVIRLISPNRFAVITGLDNNDEWLSTATLDWQVEIAQSTKGMLVLKKNPIEDSGVWTHQHGDIANASYGGESLFGSSTTEDFEAQWMGRPGARFITDRSGRKPAPLSVSGRLFIQGKERIAAVSAYNGHLLWMKDMPDLLRMNVVRDCSNWACDEDFLYIAKKGQLLKIDQLTGDIKDHISMHLESDTTHNWGYIGIDGNQLIGSTTVKGAQFTLYHGGGTEGWYDAWEGPSSYKVISNRLFSLNKSGKKLNWEYLPKGAIINATISALNGKILFVESISANNESKSTGRGQDELYNDTRLVALDILTGEKLYEKPFKTRKGKTVYFLVAGTGKCVVVASSDKKCDVVTFDVANGNKVWNTTLDWFHGNHGAHMPKPGISGDRLVVEPAILNLHTGEPEQRYLPKAGHGCAHFALTDNAVLYRGGSCTLFDFNTNVFSKWERLRPDCWVSTIPAGGMILSPEAGGGCSCGLWYETSMAFAPKSRTPIAIKAYTDDAKKDYLKETYGNFSSSCNHDEFTDTLVVELLLKKGIDSSIYYTTDGSEPTKASARYDKAFTLSKSALVRTVVYIEKAGKERRFERSKQFYKVAKDEQ